MSEPQPAATHLTSPSAPPLPGWPAHSPPPGPPARRTLTRLHRLLIAGVFALFALFAHAGGAWADPLLSVNPAGTAIRVTNTFYAYVGAGENLDVAFAKVGNVTGQTDTVITVRGPGGVVQTCTAPEAGAAGSGCSWSNLTAATPGVWQIDFSPIGATGARYSWNIDVQSGTTSINGRVYSERYTMAQFSASNANFSFWYQSEHGFLYQATYTDYNGIDSLFSSDASGVALLNTCVSAYESMDLTGPNSDTNRLWVPPAGQCGDPYKIFFENPAASLPATAQLWDGSTVWLRPPVTLPDLSNFAFTPDSPTTRSGEFTFDVTGFTGQLAVQIDANADGDYDDPEDVSIPAAVTADGTVTVPWDGLDGNGNPVPAQLVVNARVQITRVGEIHFVNQDVETRSGIAVQALNGPNTGSTTLYWNDTNLVVAGRLCTTPQLDGTAGVNSSGGVHGWICDPAAGNANDGIGGAWGDVRAIDDWTYHPFNEFEEIELGAAAPPPPFQCTSTAYLFQQFPTDVWEGNLVTGIFTEVASAIEDTHINGIGFNVLDGYIYGWSNSTAPGGGTYPTGLVRIGSDYSVQYLGIPSPLTDQTLIGRGDVDTDGQYWIPFVDEWMQIDLDPSSPTYGEVVGSGPMAMPAGLTMNNDWSFNPVDGFLYAVAHGPGGMHLVRFDRSTHIVSDAGLLAGVPTTSNFGATFMDNQGFLYISNNASGQIYRVDVTNTTAAFFAQGPPSGFNDGARCPLAPLPIDFGDAPDGYGTTLASNGPRHAVPTYDSATQTANLMLGSRIDIESDGQPTTNADGDDLDGIDDEDGIGVVPPFNPGTGSYSTQVLVSNTTGSTARLCGYLDADDGAAGFNGTFNSGNERACVDVPSAPDPQVATLNWSNLALSTTATETYLRLRLGTVAAEVESPTGSATDGEVEDYLVPIGLNCGTGTAQTIAGYAQAWTPGSTWQTATGNHARLAINAPDGQGVQLWQDQGNVLTLDMATVVPVGQVVTLYLSQPANAAFRGNVLIESSADGMTFGGAATYTPGATLPAYEPFSYNVPVGGARFIRITPQANGQSGTAVRVDGLRYSFQYCECTAAVNFVQQPSFEEFPQCSLQSGTFGNWQVIQNNAHIWGQNCTLGWVAPHGLNTVDLDGGTTGGIQQVLTGLNPGQRYNLTFYMGFNPAAGADSASMRVQVGDFDRVYTSASNATTGGFNRVYVEFTAQSSSEPLRFISLTGSGGTSLLNGGGTPGYGVVIDDVRVTTKYCDDYGDAPASYGSAAHTATGPLLGLLRDTEETSQPTPGADGDDLNGVDDEDGVTLPAVLAPGQSIAIPVTVSGGASLLQAWIDWNGNGVFDPAEQIATDLSVTTGPNTVNVTVPADAVVGTTYARFRLSTQSGLGPTGPAPDGEVEDYLVTIATPSLSATKQATLQTDADGDGVPSPGDTLRYTIVIHNGGAAGVALGVVYTDLPDANTALVVGSVTTDQGTVTSGNNAGDTTVAVDIGDIPGGGVVTIVYDVTLDNPMAAGVTQVRNQGIVDPQNPDIPDTLTDDPETPTPGDPTFVPIVAQPVLHAYKTATLAVDADGDGVPSPGDTLLYTIQIRNSGNQDAPDVSFSDLLDANTTLVVGSVTTDLGTVTAGNSAGDTSVAVVVGTLPGGGAQATITYQVTIHNPLPAGVTKIRNQGIVSSPDPNVPDLVTDDPTDPAPDDPTDVVVVAQPVLNAYKTATLAVDADGNGSPSPGDTLLYTIQIINSGNQAAPDVLYTDLPDPNTTLVVGSVASSQGAITSGNNAGDTTIAVNVGTLPGGGGQVTISYRVRINNPVPAGVTKVSNQGIASSSDPRIPDTPTDDPSTPTADDPTEVPIDATPHIAAYKTASLAVDADGNGVPSPGDTLLYTIQVVNSGNQAATGLTFLDTPDANTQLVAGSVGASQGTITSGNTAGDTSVAIDIGTLPGGGAQAEISFRVTIDNPLPAGVTKVSNQGIVSSPDPNVPDTLTDDPTDPTPDDPTDVVIVSAPVIAAYKTAILAVDADGNGMPSPGDTLLYTIQIINSGNAAAPGLTFTDYPDLHTSLVVGSVGTSLGTITTGNNPGDTSIFIDIGTLPGGGAQVEVSFRATIANPLPAGVTKVSNQGIVSSSDPSIPDVPTDDPTDPAPDDPTDVVIEARPVIDAFKKATLFSDADGNGYPSPGDTLLYTIQIFNHGNQAAPGVVFTDIPDANTTLVVGSVGTSLGTVTTGNSAGDTSIAIDIGTLPGGGQVEISYRVTIVNPLPAGVSRVLNQGVVTSSDPTLPAVPTDDPATPTPQDPTEVWLTAEPLLRATKADLLFVDGDGNGVPSPGDTLLYNVTVVNIGNAAATGMRFTDTPDANTTLVAGSVSSNRGTVSSGNSSGDTSIAVEVGILPANETLEISYRVTVHNPLPPGVTQVSNQGIVHSDNDANPCPDLPLAAAVRCPQLPTDNPNTLAAHDPTVTLLAALPDLVATKRDTLVVDVGGDLTVSPGDTLLYTVLLRNQGNVAATGVVFTDTPDPNTTLVVGSVQSSAGTVTSGNSSGDTSIRVDIGTLAAGAQVEVSYRVVVHNPFPAGVTQISNQGLLASNELPDLLTDDPDTLEPQDRTVTQVVSGGAPKAVTLVRFSATWQGDHLLIEWESSTERNVFGFRLYRSASDQRGEAVLVTPELIASQGDDGGVYQVIDRGVTPGGVYTYWLVEVALNGETSDAASITVVAGSDRLFLPLVNR